jgi:hypothetical protein
MKRPVLIGLALIFLFSAAAPAFSQAGFYLGAFAGYSGQKPSFTDVRFDTNTTFLYGVRAGVQVLMFAFEFNYWKAGHNVEMDDFLLFNWDGLESDYSFLGGSVRMMFPFVIFRPFIALGYGSYSLDIRDVDFDRDGGWNFGGGLEVKLGRLAVIGEGKWHHARFNIDEFEVKVGDFTLSAGLNFYF